MSHNKEQSENATGQFRQDRLRMTYRKMFIDKDKGTTKQYVGLYTGGRLLSTGDMLEEDARIIVQLFNEGVTRRAGLRVKRKGR